MTKEEVKQYIKDNLTFTLTKSYGDYNTIEITLSLYIEDEKLGDETVFLTEGV